MAACFLLTPICSDYVPFRNSKPTRMLPPSLSGDACISVIYTLNPDAGAVAESTSVLLFDQRINFTSQVTVSADDTASIGTQ